MALCPVKNFTKGIDLKARWFLGAVAKSRSLAALGMTTLKTKAKTKTTALKTKTKTKEKKQLP